MTGHPMRSEPRSSRLLVLWRFRSNAMPSHGNALPGSLGALDRVEKPDREGGCRICRWEVQLLPVAQVETLPRYKSFSRQSAFAAFASLWNSAIRFCSVRRLIPRISAARFRLWFTCSRVSLIYASSA